MRHFVADSCREQSAATLEQRFLQAVPRPLRVDVWTLLTRPRLGGRGLRAWLSRLEAEDSAPPESLPEDLIGVYLTDQDAEPLHDCEECGLSVPVRCSRRMGREAVVEREYFPRCPKCGGRTGRFAYWSRQARFGSSVVAGV